MISPAGAASGAPENAHSHDRMNCIIDQFLQHADSAISGDRIKNWAAKIWQSDRWSKFSRYHQTALMTRQGMRKAGLSDVKIMELEADGKTHYGDYIIPQAWEARGGELFITQPKSVARRLASYKQCPNSLFMYSAATPPSGLELEIVPWDDLKQLRPGCNQDYAGKLVFTGMDPSSIWREAANRGAAGIISMNGKQEGVHWQNYCFVPRNEKRLFGFSLRNAEGLRLQNVLRRSPRVMAKARVDATLFDGKAETVTGIVRGKSADEILAFAHLYEAGGWDNASSCASLLEISGILTSAIKKGLLPRPKRTIRFMLGWECYSIMAWMLQKKRSRVLAGLTMDGVGRDIIKDHAPLGIHGTPDANPAYPDALLAAIAGKYLKDKGNFRMWKMFPFAASDSLSSDPWFDAPMPYLYQPVPSIWHTSIDTPDGLSADSLKWSAVIGATYLWFLANAGPKEAIWLAGETARYYRGRLLDFTGDAVRLRHLRDCGLKAVDSASKLVEGKGKRLLARGIKKIKNAISIQYALERDRGESVPGGGISVAVSNEGPLLARGSSAWRKKTASRKREPYKTLEEASCLIPVRRVPGLLTLQTLPEEAKSNCRWGPGYHALVQPTLWADGKRNIPEIARAIYGETGKAPDLKDLLDSFRFLEQYGYVSLKRKPAGC